MIAQETLKALVHYDPSTGVFRWRSDYGNAKAGAVAGSAKHSNLVGKSYWQMQVGGYRADAHRFAWVYVHGDIPGGLWVDHVNGDGLDNRIENLRLATPMQNCHNRTRNTNNTSGFKGVSFDRTRGLWRAQLMYEGKRYSAGLHALPVDAAAALHGLRINLHQQFAKH